MGDYLRQAYEEATEIRLLEGQNIQGHKVCKEIDDLKSKLKLVCSVLLRKDQMYDAWIEKNIGKEYLINGKENNYK